MTERACVTDNNWLNIRHSNDSWQFTLSDVIDKYINTYINSLKRYCTRQFILTGKWLKSVFCGAHWKTILYIPSFQLTILHSYPLYLTLSHYNLHYLTLPLLYPQSTSLYTYYTPVYPTLPPTLDHPYLIPPYLILIHSIPTLPLSDILYPALLHSTLLYHHSTLLNLHSTPTLSHFTFTLPHSTLSIPHSTPHTLLPPHSTPLYTYSYPFNLTLLHSLYPTPLYPHSALPHFTLLYLSPSAPSPLLFNLLCSALHGLVSFHQNNCIQFGSKVPPPIYFFEP